MRAIIDLLCQMVFNNKMPFMTGEVLQRVIRESPPGSKVEHRALVPRIYRGPNRKLYNQVQAGKASVADIVGRSFLGWIEAIVDQEITLEISRAVAMPGSTEYGKRLEAKQQADARTLLDLYGLHLDAGASIWLLPHDDDTLAQVRDACMDGSVYPDIYKQAVERNNPIADYWAIFEPGSAAGELVAEPSLVAVSRGYNENDEPQGFTAYTDRIPAALLDWVNVWRERTSAIGLTVVEAQTQLGLVT